MTNISPFSLSGRSPERQLIRVCAPTAHAGIGDALRRAFAPPPMQTGDHELIKLLERV